MFPGLYAVQKKEQEPASVLMLLLGSAGLTLFLSAPSFYSWMVLGDKGAAVEGWFDIPGLVSCPGEPGGCRLSIPVNTRVHDLVLSARQGLFQARSGSGLKERR